MKRPYFICENCDKKVLFDAPGTRNRNHCPFCLFSKHIDNAIGDRSASCGGLMQPVGKIYKPDGEEVLVHKCRKCGKIRKNRIAGDDDWDLVEGLEELDREEYDL